MSSTSIVPSGGQLKSFWQRPEGKTGMVVLGGLAVGGGIVLWAKILPFLLVMVTNTFQLAITAAGLIAFLMIVTHQRFRYAIGLGFRLLMRALTGWFITIDPIGILKEHLLEMKKRRENMGEQISAVSGQIRFLKDTISKNSQTATQKMQYAEQAKKMAGSAADQNKALELQLQMRAQAVKTWLQAHASANFPDSRFQVAGHGAADPVASNATPDGRAQNRRVQITLSGS